MEKPPGSILIIGSGVFGLSTAWALTKRPFFQGTAITVVDNANGTFPPEDAASCDTSRIIRADYADSVYSELMEEAHEAWRKQGDDDFGGQGRYSESGLVLTANYPKKGAFLAKKTAVEYVRSSCENVKKIAEQSGQGEKVIELNSREALREILGNPDDPGEMGYLNKLSGWGDATAAMAYLQAKVQATGRVKFVDGRVKKLMTRGSHVVGADVDGHGVLNADIVFCAAGAWTAALVDVRGRAEATGHVLAHVAITPEEQAVMEKQPVVLNLSSGHFFIPPRNGLLKVARHSYGYLNPVTIHDALPLSPLHKREPIVASLPRTSRDNASEPLPAEADKDLRKALKDLLPIKGVESRPWEQTRICWYSDTRDADWLADWHPGWRGLFVATGDSGHGFKFLPVIGDRFVDLMLGKGGKLGYKWRWKNLADDGVGREKEGGVYKGLITEDGSRGGEPGMILDEEVKKGGGVRSKL